MLELVITVAIAAVVGAVAVPSYRSYVERSRTAAAIADIGDMHLRIQGYVLDAGAPPPDLAATGVAGKLDPWGRPYAYLSFEGLAGPGPMRKDRNLVPVNSQYDPCSMGQDGDSRPPFTARQSHDDIVLANDGGFIGRAEDY